MANRARAFRTPLEQGSLSLGWIIARIPFDPAEVWPKMIRLRVRGEINAFAFRTSLFPDPRGGFYLLVNRTMQKAAGAHLGDTADFRIEPDLDARAAELPDELAVLVDDEPGLRLWYDSLTEYTRREIGKWITSVKTDASRMKRAEQMAAVDGAEPVGEQKVENNAGPEALGHAELRAVGLTIRGVPGRFTEAEADDDLRGAARHVQPRA